MKLRRVKLSFWFFSRRGLLRPDRARSVSLTLLDAIEDFFTTLTRRPPYEKVCHPSISFSSPASCARANAFPDYSVKRDEEVELYGRSVERFWLDGAGWKAHRF